jgi:hypothetical protein
MLSIMHAMILGAYSACFYGVPCGVLAVHGVVFGRVRDGLEVRKGTPED